MNLAEKLKQVKDKIKPVENELFIVLVIILVALISFGLGRLSKIRESKTPITIENAGESMLQGPAIGDKAAGSGGSAGISSAPSASTDKLFVASKNGTKYHYPWCSGAATIKEENKIWFSSKEQAEAAGYQPAANCKGL
jgi:hypothetical protein